MPPQMSKYYVACDLGAESGRVMLGTLHEDSLTISEVRSFPNTPILEKDAWLWNIPWLYEEILQGLNAVGTYEEAVDSISCDSWGGDYLLFERDGSLITPTYHYRDRRGEEGMRKVGAAIPPEALYAETGGQLSPGSTLSQLAAEKPRRLARAERLLPVADAFNYLLAGVARGERSLAGATRLYNPATRAWSPRLLQAAGVPARLLPPLVAAGTELGPLQPAIAKSTHLEDTVVVASCSDQTAAALTGLPVPEGESWAYLRLGSRTDVGALIGQPILTEAARAQGFTHEPGYGDSIRFFKQTMGLWLLEECRRFWKAQDREIDDALLTHLAGASPAFEALIDPADPRFAAAGDMPLKVQAFCRETRQPVPRKPGAIIRCVLESLALSYRQALEELEALAGRPVARLYLLGGAGGDLLQHFIANAVRRPVVAAPPDAAALGNVVAQALALGHLTSLEQARELLRHSTKTSPLQPYATAWDAAFARLRELRAA
ncbi:MAG TPA: FGGY family carbohydrate kinase [Verrucomicrobiota bacterium]|nr:rhamnulokinase [Verrucomicrobiota bacterium]HRR64790.1 FGGY family carbohydrate kinase [Candidatus Paceibacterota bacterium]HOF70735.1 FGGY family carbohydrate kinase [Verrucomicrobiota bacterium]HOM45426.1 FGGY family carbohydrate kinase [Verrucomicrobiota bacterium]HOQ55638.1 FGGY family carbohydrate kinase [Verrucomicrobiota bacterium]